MSNLQSKIEEAVAILKVAREEHGPIEMWAGFSGGHDSVCVAHLMATQMPEQFSGTFHANTGFGVEATRQYVRDLSASQGWPLREIKTPESYRRIVKGIGFPGAAYHRIMYSRLKDRPVMQHLRERKAGHKRTTRILLATGIRNDESRKRMGYSDTVTRTGSLVWVNPLLHWTHDDREEYIAQAKLPRNLIADQLGMSGECMCGAYARPGELERLRSVDPELAAEIDDLNQEIIPRLGWGWEEQPPKGHVTPQEELRAVLTKAPLCAACDMRHNHNQDHG